MKAIVQDRYGPPDVLHLSEVDRPELDPDRVLVRVHAAAINPVDWHTMRGSPRIIRLSEGLGRPKQPGRGSDFAGVVEAVGADVTGIGVGDEVMGVRTGSLAEYVAAKKVAPKPARLSFEQAAAIPVAGGTALEALRDHGHVEPGHRVLVNGAAGGVGTFAVQIAKAFGAHVTGVCSGRNVELVRSLGADAVIDYTVEDFTRDGSRYDLVLDLVGNRSPRDMRRALTPKGTGVLIGGASGLTGAAKTFFLNIVVGQRLLFFLAKIEREVLDTLKDLVDSGQVTPVIDRTYPLEEAPEAMRHLEDGHARGKVVVKVS